MCLKRNVVHAGGTFQLKKYKKIREKNAVPGPNNNTNPGDLNHFVPIPKPNLNFSNIKLKHFKHI